MVDSQQLLSDYVRNGSESAFRELVRRYINFVYSTALRSLNSDSHLAEDIAQTVFADLARQAVRLPADVQLGGWLHRHTCFTAAKAVRGELRRRRRESQAMEMDFLNRPANFSLRELGPVLDDAINQLDVPERNAVLLRFFEQRDFRAVGATLGISEDAARMRVNRALDKLQRLLRDAGITCMAAALGNSLILDAVGSAPAGFAGVCSAHALAIIGGAGAGGGLAAGVLKWLKRVPAKAALVSGVSAFVVVIGVHSRPWRANGPPPSAPALAKAMMSQPPLSTRFEALQARAEAIASQPPGNPGGPRYRSGPVAPDAPVAQNSTTVSSALDLFSALTNRTILHGFLQELSGALQRMEADPVNGSDIFEREFSAAGWLIVPEGHKFLLIIRAADRDKPRLALPTINRQKAAGFGGEAATNKIDFTGIDFDTFLSVYAAILDRNIIRPANLQVPPLQIKSAIRPDHRRTGLRDGHRFAIEPSCGGRRWKQVRANCSGGPGGVGPHQCTGGTSRARKRGHQFVRRTSSNQRLRPDFDLRGAYPKKRGGNPRNGLW